MPADSYDNLAAVYDRYAGETARTVWRLGVGAELAKLASGPATVLDLGAGTGIGAEVLSEMVAEMEVISLDRSEQMLRHGGVPPQRRIVADMAAFDVAPRRFDFVVAGFGSLNYLPADRLADCLACVSNALRPGGHLLFDYCSRRLLSADADTGPMAVEFDGHRLLRHRHAYEARFARSRTFLSLYRGDELLWHDVHVQYTLDPFELEELARGDGMATVLVRNLADRYFSPAEPAHLYVMRRVD